MSAVREVSLSPDFPVWVQNYKEPANRAKADGQFKELFALGTLFNDRTRQPTSAQLTQSVSVLTRAVEACKDVPSSRMAPVVSLAARLPLISKVLPEGMKVTNSLRADKARLETLLATAKTHEALYNKELAGIENRQVVLPLTAKVPSLESLQGKINLATITIEGQKPENLELLFALLISMTKEEADVTTRVKTFAKEGVIIPEGLQGRDLALLQAASPERFVAMSQAFVTHCQGHRHKDKSVYFTPHEVVEARKVSIKEGKVVLTTEYQLKRRVDGEIFATIQGVYDAVNCKFHTINLLAIANRADVQKFNRVSNKVEAATGATI